MKNKVKTVIFTILGIMLLYCLLLFIQNLIAKNEIKKLSDDEYISIYKDDGVSYHMAPPISKEGDFLNLKNRKLYKVISFNKYNINFIFVKKSSKKK